jgi:hypothetical protein
MKRINYGAVSYLVGDEVADTIVRYTAMLAAEGDADAVEVNVLGPDGNPEMATFALGPGILMTAETTRSELEPPGNEDATAYMQERLQRHAKGAQPRQPIDDMIADFQNQFGE